MLGFDIADLYCPNAIRRSRPEVVAPEKVEQLPLCRLYGIRIYRVGEGRR